MRHYRRQNSGSERVKKIMFRILFVLIAAAVITFGTILLGNYLQNKVAEAENALESTPENNDPDSEDDPYGENGNHYDSPTVFGATVILSDYASEDEVVLAVNELSPSYDTVIIPVTTDDGVLLYQSPALCELTRMPAPEDDPDYRLFSAAASAVKAKKLRLCVMLTPNSAFSSLKNSALIDGSLISELAQNGADEILITLPDDVDKISSRDAEMLSDYIVECRDISDNACPIGVLLSSESYLDTDSAKRIQEIASAVSFLSIKFPIEVDSTSASAYRYVTRSITSLLGSFNVYNMRVILDCPPELLAPMYQACKDSDISNLCFASYVQPDALSYREQASDTTDETLPPEESADPEANTNPYATTSQNPPDETESTNYDEPTQDTDDTSREDKPWY